MDQEIIRKKIRDYITANFAYGLAGNEGLDDITPLVENGIVDSTGVIEIIAFLEDEFNIRVEDEEILPGNINSINALYNLVFRKLS